MSPELPEVDTVQSLIQTRIEKLSMIASELPEYLDLIQAAAAGGSPPREAVLRATGLIMDNLYRGVLSPRMSVPRDFWTSSLGLMIARAHTQVVPDSEVLSQAEAAQWLGVSREYISQLVESGRVATIVREAAALRSRKQPREMLFRDSLESLKRQLRSDTKRRRTDEILSTDPVTHL